MSTLDKQLRNELARTVLAARALAEEAAGKALHALGVDEADAPGHLENAGRTLRRKLRAQARQLGDRADTHKTGRYSTGHLTEKVAYDHWHRLLFARFLAENDLLISPDHGVGVSLSDCEELAPTLGLKDGWEVAARFAARMLPQIFRIDDPAGNVLFAPEDRTVLRKLVLDLPREIFLADDALGWVYQFWQAQRKDEVNASEKKIGADEISPVTQLFTEDYMVWFLLHNTLGAWWAGKHLDKLKGCATEEDCRRAVSLPGVNWEYLRFIKDEASGDWRPAAGTFDGWPKAAKELRVLDPCMGSGHFVVFELPILVAVRLAEEGLTREEGVAAVLRDNLFGLEIDPRCTQIAAFNLALAAWKLAGKYINLPMLNLACCGLGINATREEWLALAPGEGFLMGQFYDLFKDAPILGSLINPARNIKTMGGVPVVGKIETAVFQGLEKFRANKDFDHEELGVTAQGITGAFRLLSGQYHLVATNVPYLGRGKQEDVLKEFCEREHPHAKADIATCFVGRCLGFCADGASTALVSPQSWLFQSTFKRLRQDLLTRSQWDFIARLGPKGFQTPMWDFPVVLIGLSSATPRSGQLIFGLDVGSCDTPTEKDDQLHAKVPVWVKQRDQVENPDAKIVLGSDSGVAPLSDYAFTAKGLCSGDSTRFQRCFWECDPIRRDWAFQQGSIDVTKHFGGRETIFFWEDGNGQFLDWVIERLGENGTSAWIRGRQAWGRQGVAIRIMGELPITRFTGEIYDNNVAVVVPKLYTQLPAVWAFCSSERFNRAVRELNQKISVTDESFVQVPFDLAHWQKVAAEEYPDGLPKPHSDDPTQWLFNGHPKGSEAPLQVAVARLLGYRWPRQTGSEFPDCPALGPDGLETLVDADGIVCINAIKGEQPAAERLRTLLAAAFGQDWSAKKQAELLAAVGYEGQSLEDWLRNGFFEQHCALFHQRPFIWHLWDGLRDGFSALVNYHRLNRSTLEKLTFTYLGDWIARQKATVADNVEGSDAKLAAAQELQASLKKILEGEAPHDIFVRWKPIEKQPIGWDPDLNDGVRLNIRPFMTVPDIGRKGAGILRWPPKIKWEKDRGKDVPSAPWYKLFKGDRINDHHLTLAEKREARGD